MPKKLLTLPDTPAALGYRMPAEWEPHEATWIAWPHNRADWPGKFDTVLWIYAEIVRHLARVEQVNILVDNEAAEAKARQVLVRSQVIPEKAAVPGRKSATYASSASRRIECGRAITVRSLCAASRRKKSCLPSRRPPGDSTPGPSTTTGNWTHRWERKSPGRLRMPAWQPHLRVNGEMHRIVLEGGSIDVNGRGTLITTEECLLSDVQQRNPGLSREHVEEMLADYLGIEKVIWLERGIAGDDTHGHVDDITRFVGPRTVVTAYEPDPDDANHEPLSDNFRWLKKSTDQSGKSLKVVKLPMPAPVYFEDQRLPASYANFYIANKLVLVPTFGDPNDRVALNTLAEMFPDREIVGIYCRDFIWGLGALHCMTQQQPAP